MCLRDNRNMIGIDIVHLKRIKIDSSFTRYILTEEEMKILEQKNTTKQRIDFVGGRFAAKEALFKCTQDKNYLKYSILNDANGKPYVKDHPEIEISISHDGEYAVAIAQYLNS